MKKAICLALAALIAAVYFISPAGAQNDQVRNKVEKAAERKDLREDARATRGDALDLARLEQLRSEFSAARISGDEQALSRVDNAISSYLAGEKAESQKETAAANQEVRRDLREKRSDRREIRDNRREAASPRERRDDRRDLRDDRRDAAAENAQREKVQTIRAAWMDMQGNFGAASLERRAHLLDELVELAKNEMARGIEETQEDRRELREDRRESREDRREK